MSDNWTAESTAAPREELLCDLFAQVLGVGRVGVEDSFFDLGGNSLLAAVLVARVAERFGAKISLRNFLREPSVNGIDTHLGELLGGKWLTPAQRPAR